MQTQDSNFIDEANCLSHVSFDEQKLCHDSDNLSEIHTANLRTSRIIGNSKIETNVTFPFKYRPFNLTLGSVSRMEPLGLVGKPQVFIELKDNATMTDEGEKDGLTSMSEIRSQFSNIHDSLKFKTGVSFRNNKNLLDQEFLKIRYEEQVEAKRKIAKHEVFCESLRRECEKNFNAAKKFIDSEYAGKRQLQKEKLKSEFKQLQAPIQAKLELAAERERKKDQEIEKLEEEHMRCLKDCHASGLLELEEVVHFSNDRFSS